MLPTVTTKDLLQRLDALHRDLPGPAALVFDADGTLWSGDIGDDVFFHAVEAGLLRPAARDALERAARAHGLELEGTASEMGGALYEQFRRQRVPELAMYEAMTWCFAGFTPDELAALARDALLSRHLKDRLHRPLASVLKWAREAEVRTVVVSASPQIALQQAAPIWGFGPGEVLGSQPVVGEGRIQPAMAAPVPYAERKAEAGRELLGEATWLGAFGDSAFDYEMLCQARLPVAIGPKPELRARLEPLRHAVELRL